MPPFVPFALRSFPSLTSISFLCNADVINRSAGGQRFPEGRLGRTEATHLDRNGARRVPKDHVLR